MQKTLLSIFHPARFCSVAFKIDEAHRKLKRALFCREIPLNCLSWGGFQGGALFLWMASINYREKNNFFLWKPENAWFPSSIVHVCLMFFIFSIIKRRTGSAATWKGIKACTVCCSLILNASRQPPHILYIFYYISPLVALRLIQGCFETKKIHKDSVESAHSQKKRGGGQKAACSALLLSPIRKEKTQL